MRRARTSPQIHRTTQQLETAVRELTDVDASAADARERAATWAGKISPLLDTLDNELRELRRQTNIGAYS